MVSEYPLCALCGQNIENCSVLVLNYSKEPGSPSVGWHAGGFNSCVDRDSLKDCFFVSNLVSLNILLLIVEKRGRGRVLWKGSKSWEAKQTIATSSPCAIASPLRCPEFTPPMP